MTKKQPLNSTITNRTWIPNIDRDVVDGFLVPGVDAFLHMLSNADRWTSPEHMHPGKFGKLMFLLIHQKLNGTESQRTPKKGTRARWFLFEISWDESEVFIFEAPCNFQSYVEISHEKSKVFSTFANQFPQPDFTPSFQSGGDSWMYPDPKELLWEISQNFALSLWICMGYNNPQESLENTR